MHRVMLLNPKGGSGKTTIATCLASFFAHDGLPTVLIDHDAQGSSTRWLGVRPQAYAPIHGVEAYRNPVGVTRSWAMRLPSNAERMVVDTPAGVRVSGLLDLIHRADTIIIPVLPSPIDIDAAASFIEDLRKVEYVRKGITRVAVVANRVRRGANVLHGLESFLSGAGFPFVGILRDSQNYVRASEGGIGIHDVPGPSTRTDRRQWAPLLAWVENRPIEEFMPDDETMTPMESTYPLPI